MIFPLPESWLLTGPSGDCTRYPDISPKSSWCISGMFQPAGGEGSPGADHIIDTIVANGSDAVFSSCWEGSYVKVNLYFDTSDSRHS